MTVFHANNGVLKHLQATPLQPLIISIITLNISKMVESEINRKWECDDNMRHD